MALLAARSQRPLVGIGTGMAAVTALILDRGFDITGVALFAGHLLMGTLEQKTGFAVIKAGGFPLRYRVALLAITAIASLVNIIPLMAAVTGGGRLVHGG